MSTTAGKLHTEGFSQLTRLRMFNGSLQYIHELVGSEVLLVDHQNHHVRATITRTEPAPIYEIYFKSGMCLFAGRYQQFIDAGGATVATCGLSNGSKLETVSEHLEVESVTYCGNARLYRLSVERPVRVAVGRHVITRNDSGFYHVFAK